MSKFIKVDVLNGNNPKGPSPIVLNIDDISYIEGNEVRMKSLVAKERFNKEWMDSELFKLTDESLAELLKTIIG